MRAANFLPVVALSGLLFFGAGFSLTAQTSNGKAPRVLALSSGQSVRDLNPYLQAALLPVGISLDSAQVQAFGSFDPLNLSPSKIGQAQLPVNVWLRFALCNATQKDTLAVWFHLGEAECAHFYQLRRNGFFEREVGFGTARQHVKVWTDLAYHRIDLMPGDTVHCYYATNPLRVHFKEKTELLSEKDLSIRSVGQSQAFAHARYTSVAIFSLLFFLSFFFAIQYLQNRYLPYLWYAVYLLALGLFFMRQFEVAECRPFLFGHFPITLTMNELPWVAFTFIGYLQFTNAFFDLPHTAPRSAKWFAWFTRLNVALLAAGILSEVFFYHQNYGNRLYAYCGPAIGLLQVVCLVLLFRVPGRPERMVFVGSLVLVVTSALTMLLPYEWRKSVLGPDHLILLKMGAALEILLLSSAIGLKIRQMELEWRKSVLLRERIARDLHDEMGSTLSSISMLSETALLHLQGDNDRRRFAVIGERTRQVMDTMGDIVWSVNPRNDNMENVLRRMKEFASETLEAQSMSLHFEADETVLQFKLPMEQRKDFYLIFKEVVNNAAKYAQGSDVWVSVKIENGVFSFEVRDNGQGFDPEQVKEGNGLWNIRQRAGYMGGKIDIKSVVGTGTQITLSVPIT